jgi:2-polyprenyl-3-methyl-5-hydroxy-6-metoxy-1,4-benzoquinol methylase
MLRRAKDKAYQQNLAVEFFKMDARNLSFSEEFNLVMMLCEGAFPLMETDEMNYLILKNAVQALKPNGKIIFTTLNGLFPLTHSVDDFLAQAKKDVNGHYKNNTFDLMTMRYHSIVTIVDDIGISKKIETNERYYMPSEIAWLLKSLNLRNIGIYGANLGAFSRNDKLTTEDFEMLVVAEK